MKPRTRVPLIGVLVVITSVLAFATGNLRSEGAEASLDQVKEASTEIVWPADLATLRQTNQRLDRYLRVGEESLLKACKKVKVPSGEDTLEIELTVNRLGEVAKSRVEHSSGSPERDRAAQKALTMVIGERPTVEGLACPTCAWYVRVKLAGPQGEAKE